MSEKGLENILKAVQECNENIEKLRNKMENVKTDLASEIQTFAGKVNARLELQDEKINKLENNVVVLQKNLIHVHAS